MTTETESGCAFICADPQCNEGTYDLKATCCSHCGSTELRLFHPSGSFDAERQAFVCSTCGGEMHTAGTAHIRKMAKSGELDQLTPGASDLFDLTDH